MRRDDDDAYDVPTRAPLPASAARIVSILGPLVTEARLSRMQGVLAARTRSVAVVLEAVDDPHNASAIMRSADAFGVQDVHVVAGPHGFIAAHRVARGAHRWLDIVRHESAAACVAELHAGGYEVLVASMDGEIAADALAARTRVAVAFGNEHRGASEALRSGADGTFAVPMRGFVESLNVSVAAAVTLHAATRGRAGDLDEAAKEELLARWLLADVRDAHLLLG